MQFDNTKGYPGEGPRPPKGLSVATLNKSTLKSAAKYICQHLADCDVVCIQEARLTYDNNIAGKQSRQEDSIRRELDKAGFRLTIEYGRATQKHGISAGVAIAYKRHLAVYGTSKQMAHRCVGIHLHTKTFGDLTICSYYGNVHGNNEGRNSDLRSILDQLRQRQGSYLIGGDFNQDPGATHDGLPQGFQGSILRPGAHTCLCGGGLQGSEIDYYLASHRLRLAVLGEVTIEQRGACAPHRPVRVCLKFDDPIPVEVFERPRIHDSVFPGPLREQAYTKAAQLEASIREYYARHQWNPTGTRSTQRATDEDLEWMDTWLRAWKRWASGIIRDRHGMLETEHVQEDLRFDKTTLVQVMRKGAGEEDRRVNGAHFVKRHLERLLDPRPPQDTGGVRQLAKVLGPQTMTWLSKCYGPDDWGQAFESVVKDAQKVTRAKLGGRHHLLTISLALEQAEALFTKAKEFHVQRRQDSWNDFLQAQLRAGSGALHAMTRDRPHPAEVGAAGAITKGMATEMSTEIAKWDQVWKVGEEDEQGLEDETLEAEVFIVPPPPTAADVKWASTRFRWQTASIDGICARHLGYLPDEGVTSLGLFMGVMEVFGCGAPHEQNCLVRMLGKPKGGYRPIFLFRTLHRVLNKLRGGAVRQWEIKTLAPLGVYNNEAHRRILDGVWRGVLRRLAAKGAETQAHWVSLCRDLTKAFDTVPRKAVWDTAKRYGYPMYLLRSSFRSYSYTRRLLFDYQVVGPPRVVGHGICPGSMTATRELKLALLPGLLGLINTGIPVSLSAHVDDIRAEVQGTSAAEAKNKLRQIGGGLDEIFRELGMKQAADKEEIVASSPGLAEACAAAVGAQTGRPYGEAAVLGIDMVSGGGSTRKRVKWTRPKTRARLQKHRLRVQLIRAKLRGHKQAKKACRQVYMTGVLKGIEYGAELTVYSAATTRRLESEAKRAIGIDMPGVFKEVSDLLVPVQMSPTHAVRSAPLLQWSREWWAIGLEAAGKQPDELTGVELWRIQCQLRRHLINQSRPQEAALQCLVDSLAHFQLKVSDGTPGVICEDTTTGTWPGTKELDLKWCSPGDFRQFLADRRKHLLELKVGAKFHWPPDLRPNSDIWHIKGQVAARQLGRVIMGTPTLAEGEECRRCKKHTALKHQVMGCPLDGPPTGRHEKASKAYQVLTQAEECGYNRPWQMLFQRRSQAAEILRQAEGSWDNFKVEVLAGDSGEHIPSGMVYTDGSGLHPRHGICRRAGWGLHVKGNKGGIIEVHGAVPSPLPQTATVAEVTALCHTLRLMEHGATVVVVTDCQAVVTGFESGPDKLRSGRRHAGVWRNIWCTIREKQLNVTLRKTKAHRSEKEARAQGDVADYLGNQAADRLAGQGARLIGPPESAVTTEIRMQAGEVAWVKAMGSHLPGLWRRGGEGFTPRAKKIQGEEGPILRCRAAGYVGGDATRWWWCDRCGKNSKSRAALGKARCTGQDRLAAISIANHHDTMQWTVLSGTWQGKTLWGCSSCGSTGTRRAEGLGRPCPGNATGHRKWVLTQLGKGRHPNGKDVVEACQRVRAQHETQGSAVQARDPGPPPPNPGWEQGVQAAVEFWAELPQKPDDTSVGCSYPCRGPCGPGVSHPQSGGGEQHPEVSPWRRRHGFDSSEADSQSEPSQLDVSDGACWAEPPVFP
jgi:hypothetical protein